MESTPSGLSHEPAPEQPAPIPTAAHAPLGSPPAEAPPKTNEVAGTHTPDAHGELIGWVCQICGRGHATRVAGAVRCTCGALHIVL